MQVDPAFPEGLRRILEAGSELDGAHGLPVGEGCEPLVRFLDPQTMRREQGRVGEALAPFAENGYGDFFCVERETGQVVLWRHDGDASFVARDWAHFESLVQVDGPDALEVLLAAPVAELEAKVGELDAEEKAAALGRAVAQGLLQHAEVLLTAGAPKRGVACALAHCQDEALAVEMLALLTRYRVNPNGLTKGDSLRLTPLMCAAQLGRKKLMRALIAAGADPALRDAYGRTAADWSRRMLAARRGR